MRIIGFCLLLAPLLLGAQGRLLDEMASEEEMLKASTKQLNQFFRRFNGEEDEDGNRYYPDDRKYRDIKLRKKYLPVLFNFDNPPQRDVVESFVEEMIEKDDPTFINLHTDGLVAEVRAQFSFNGREESLLMYMILQEQGKGYEWVISDISYSRFSKLFQKDNTETKPFIHPMSHELTFMNLNKAFRNGRPESYTSDEFEPDQLTLFLYEMNSGGLKFNTVQDVKFHLFGIDGWYLEVSNYNRSTGNSGWLISNLLQVSPEELEQVKTYVYGR